MTPRLVFNLGAALILAGLACLLTLDHLPLLPMACVGLVGIALILAGVLLIETAEEKTELEG